MPRGRHWIVPPSSRLPFSPGSSPKSWRPTFRQANAPIVEAGCQARTCGFRTDLQLINERERLTPRGLAPVAAREVSQRGGGARRGSEAPELMSPQGEIQAERA